jgi:hypothetical protein
MRESIHRHRPSLPRFGCAVAAGLLAWATASAATPTPGQGPAVWDKSVAREAFLERAHKYLSSLAASRLLTQACEFPQGVLATQNALEEAYRHALLDLNLATEEQIRAWEDTQGAKLPDTFAVTPAQCTTLGQRLNSARPQYLNTLQDIAELRKSLQKE